MPSKVKPILKSFSDLQAPTPAQVTEQTHRKIVKGILPKKTFGKTLTLMPKPDAEEIKKLAEDAPVYEAPAVKPKIYRDPKTGRMISAAKYAELMQEAPVEEAKPAGSNIATANFPPKGDPNLGDGVEEQVEPTAEPEAEHTAEVVKDDEQEIEAEAVAEDDEEFIDDKEEEIRAILIDQLLAFDSGSKGDLLRDTYARMSTTQLQDQLTLLQLEWGGSAKMKASLEAVQALIKRAQDNPITKARMSLLAIKYKEYHRLAQQVEKALGTDTVINGMQHKEYHAQLKSVIQTNAVLGSAIREMADLIAFKVGDEPEDGNLAPANVAELVRICLATGTSAKAWLTAMAEGNKRNTVLEAELKRAKEQLKAVNEALGNSRDQYAKREDELRKQQHARFGNKFALVNYDGHFLSVDEDADAINPRTLSFVPEMERALLVGSEEKVRRVFDRLRAWSRLSSKYRKLVIKKGLHPDGITLVRVTLMKV